MENLGKQFKYINPEAALCRVLKSIDVIKDIEEVDINNVVGRVLAEDIISVYDIPPYDTAHFDGYVVNHEDTLDISYERKLVLIVRGTIPPNTPHNYEISKGETYRIWTGGYMPKGADAIAPIESVKKIGDEKIELTRKLKPLEHVITRGSDYQQNELIFKKGRVIKPQDVNMLMYLGIRKMKVYRKPIISVMAVGSELNDKNISPHTFTIMKLIEEIGGKTVDLGIFSDDLDDIVEGIKMGLNLSDLLITIGGCSIGEYDLVPDAILSMPNSMIMVRGIKRIPGRQTSFAIVNGKPILMLPGLIQSMIIGFYTIGIPVILKLGNVNAKILNLKVRVLEVIDVNNMLSFERVLFGKIIDSDGELKVKLFKGNSMLRRMLIESHGFIIVPPFKKQICEGEIFEFNFLKPILID